MDTVSLGRLYTCPLILLQRLVRLLSCPDKHYHTMTDIYHVLGTFNMLYDTCPENIVHVHLFSQHVLGEICHVIGDIYRIHIYLYTIGNLCHVRGYLYHGLWNMYYVHICFLHVTGDISHGHVHVYSNILVTVSTIYFNHVLVDNYHVYEDLYHV
jgi:hypothetical protein